MTNDRRLGFQSHARQWRSSLVSDPTEDKRVVISGTAGKEIEIITCDAFIIQEEIS